MAPPPDRKRLARLLEDQELLVRQAFNKLLRDVRSPEVLVEITRLLRNRDIESAFQLIDGYFTSFSNVIPRVFQRAARLEMDNQTQILRPLAGARAISFDPGDTRAAALMRRNQVQLLLRLSQEQRRATTLALGEALAVGSPPGIAANAFRNSLGLNEVQYRAVQNYRRLLESGSKEALAREARDRKFDRKLRDANKRGEPLEAKQIDRMVDRYRAGLLVARASTIARTEALRTTSLARAEAIRQTIDNLGLDRSRIRRVWNTTIDDRTRDSHVGMDGQEVGIDEPFVSGAGNRLMYPGDPSAPASEIANCRCVITNQIQ